MGRFDDALKEFNKALMIEPKNSTAQKFVNDIFQQENAGGQEEEAVERSTSSQPVKRPTKEEAMNEALGKLDNKETLDEKLEKKKDNIVVANVKVTGEAQLSLGMTPEETIWKRANADLNEKNSRILSDAAFNNRINTFDTRIYDRVRVNLDTQNPEGLNFHSNIVVDPWSFTGKSSKVTISSDFGDTADVELKYWSNTGYTANEILFSNRLGNSFALPEIKVKNGKTAAMNINGGFWPPDTFHLPSTKINREFQPLRELWLDYAQDGAKIRFFPMAYQDQALTSDDPLVLSNNHMWWQQSPWIDRWITGRINSGVAQVDFTKGKLDDSLSYFTRDSDGTRLTALRGLAFELVPDERLSFNSTFASPKGLWQDYDSFDNVINASRLKYRILDNLDLGSIFTYRVGLNEKKQKDMTNFVGGLDLAYELIEGLKAALEVALSRSHRDLSASDYETKLRGNAYQFSLMGTFPSKSIMDLKAGYPEIKPEESDSFFVKYKFNVTHMDKGFDPALSNYRETRDDTFWSRHIHFRTPFEYYFTGLYKPTLTWDGIDPYRIGNGIDIARDVFALRVETSLPEQSLNNLFDVRNVHKTNGKFVENVARDELTCKVTDKLTTKFLGIYQRLPKTKGGIDPFIASTETDLFLINSAIPDAEDPTLKTGSLGLEYAFTDWVSLSGIWERTNDSTLAYDNFPRGDLNTSSLGDVYTENGKIFRRDFPSLYSQGLFPLPPYPFYNIWKTGLRFNPIENMQVYLDYARNEFKSAGYIDDNINHIGLEFSYLFNKKMQFFCKYTYSRWNDLERMVDGLNKIYLGHHNFFSELRYYPSTDDEFALQYGESGIAPISTVSFDPFGGSLSTLDARHIFRMYYRRKF